MTSDKREEAKSTHMITNHQDLNLTSRPQTVKDIQTQVLSRDGFNVTASNPRAVISSIDERSYNLKIS